MSESKPVENGFGLSCGMMLAIGFFAIVVPAVTVVGCIGCGMIRLHLTANAMIDQQEKAAKEMVGETITITSIMDLEAKEGSEWVRYTSDSTFETEVVSSEFLHVHFLRDGKEHRVPAMVIQMSRNGTLQRKETNDNTLPESK